MKLSKIIICLCFVTYCMASTAQTIRVSIDKSQIILGDQFILDLKIESESENYHPEISLENFDNQSEIQILDQDNLYKENLNPGFLFNQQFTLSIYDTGYYEIPKLIVRNQLDANTRTLISNSIPIEVLAPQIDSFSLAPIKPIIKEDWKIEDALIYIYLLLGLIFIALVIWAIVRQKEEPAIVLLPSLNPYEEAEKALTNLKEKQLWQQGKIKQYQSELTDALRKYLNEGFDIPALESSSSEIIRRLQDEQFDATQIQSLEEMLNVADLVKFAQSSPGPETHMNLMKSAESFLQSSKDAWKQKEIERIEEVKQIKAQAELEGFIIAENSINNFKQGQKIRIASLGQRLLAEVLDFVIIILVYFILQSLISRIVISLNLSFDIQGPLTIGISIFICLILFFGAEVYFGARPAKRFMGMQTVNLELRKLSWSEEFKRNQHKLFSLLNLPRLYKNYKENINITQHDQLSNSRVIIP